MAGLLAAIVGYCSLAFAAEPEHPIAKFAGRLNAPQAGAPLVDFENTDKFLLLLAMYAHAIMVFLLLFVFVRALWLMALYKTPFLRTIFWSVISDVVASIPTIVLLVAVIVTSGWLHVVYQQADDVEKMGIIGLGILTLGFCMYRLSPHLHKKVLFAGLGIRQEPAKNKKLGRAKAWLLGVPLALLLLYVVALARDIKRTSDPDYRMPTFNWEAHGHKRPPDPDPPLPDDDTQYYKPAAGPISSATLEAAQRGDSVAQYKAGMHILRVVPAAEDHEAGIKLLKQSAEQGYAPAQYNLGYRLVARIDAAEEGMAWLRKAAGQNYFSAQLFLARLYALGVGVTVDMAEARRWARKARSSAVAPQTDDGDQDLFFENGYYSPGRRAAVAQKTLDDYSAGMSQNELLLEGRSLDGR